MTWVLKETRLLWSFNQLPLGKALLCSLASASTLSINKLTNAASCLFILAHCFMGAEEMCKSQLLTEEHLPAVPWMAVTISEAKEPDFDALEHRHRDTCPFVILFCVVGHYLKIENWKVDSCVHS